MKWDDNQEACNAAYREYTDIIEFLFIDSVALMPESARHRISTDRN